MQTACFVDTNILIYAHDRNCVQKQQQAASLLEELWETRRGRISAQVLAELCAVLHRKFKLPAAEILAVEGTYRIWCSVDTTPALIAYGVDLLTRYQLSFFDALIVAAAATSGASILLSEDFNPGQNFDGVRVFNPFVTGFALKQIL